MRPNLILNLASILMLAVLTLAVAPAFAAETDPGAQKKKDIRKLLEVSGIYDQLDLMKNNLLNQYSMGFAGAYPKTPDAFWEEYYDLITQKDIDQLVEKIIPVYDRHMSHSVVRELIRMFETPFWVEWKNKMPAISREAGLVGSEWGQGLLQSDAFNASLKALMKKHDLEGLNK